MPKRERAIYDGLTPDGPVSDALGKLWASPVTAAGAALGSLNVLASRLAGNKDARVTLGNNAIQFENGLIGANRSAFTLGNSVLYGPNTRPDTPITRREDKKGPLRATYGDHERAHTHQFTSPLFPTLYIGSRIADGIRGKPNRYEVEADDFAAEQAAKMKRWIIGIIAGYFLLALAMCCAQYRPILIDNDTDQRAKIDITNTLLDKVGGLYSVEPRGDSATAIVAEVIS